jgi:acetyl esterase/lipase
MPFGYAFSVGLLAFCTATAVIGPRPPHTTPSHWSFWATFLINEQPFIAIYLLVADSALALSEGDLASPGGKAVFAVAVLTVAGLGILIARAFQAGKVLSQTGPRNWVHILVAPLSYRRRDVTIARNISYGEAGKQNLLDVYHRRDGRGDGPVLVFFHGGGFRIGSKNREARSMLGLLASQGWVCVNANYRLAPGAGYPDHHVDAKKVIAWVREHIGEYGGNPRTIIASGSSAGGHLAAMTALTANDPSFQPGFEGADTSVAAAIGFYGYYGRVDGPGSSPLDRLRDASPFLFVHGDKDSSTLVEDTRALVTRLREVSTQPVVYAELPGAQHTFDLFYSLRYSQVIEAVAAFGAWLHPAER